MHPRNFFTWLNFESKRWVIPKAFRIKHDWRSTVINTNITCTTQHSYIITLYHHENLAFVTSVSLKFVDKANETIHWTKWISDRIVPVSMYAVNRTRVLQNSTILISVEQRIESCLIVVLVLYTRKSDAEWVKQKGHNKRTVAERAASLDRHSGGWTVVASEVRGITVRGHVSRLDRLFQNDDNETARWRRRWTMLDECAASSRCCAQSFSIVWYIEQRFVQQRFVGPGSTFDRCVLVSSICTQLGTLDKRAKSRKSHRKI